MPSPDFASSGRVRPFRAPGRGFTLIEVMVSLVIFTLGAVVLGSAYVNVLNSYEIARTINQKDSGIDFARSQLLIQSDLQTAETGTEFDDGTEHIKWTAEITPANETDLFSVTFTCQTTDTSKASAEPETTVETFMLLRPTWSDPTARAQLRQAAATRIAQVQGKQTP